MNCLLQFDASAVPTAGRAAAHLRSRGRRLSSWLFLSNFPFGFGEPHPERPLPSVTSFAELSGKAFFCKECLLSRLQGLPSVLKSSRGHVQKNQKLVDLIVTTLRCFFLYVKSQACSLHTRLSLWHRTIATVVVIIKKTLHLLNIY